MEKNEEISRLLIIYLTLLGTESGLIETFFSVHYNGNAGTQNL